MSIRTGRAELRQGVIQLLPRHRRRGADQLVRELTPESGGDLCHLARQRQAVEPRQCDAWSDVGIASGINGIRRRRLIAGCHQQAALEHGLCQLLDEQGHAVGPIRYLIGDLLRQGPCRR
jgi:hypothetical protein